MDRLARLRVLCPLGSASGNCERKAAETPAEEIAVAEPAAQRREQAGGAQAARGEGFQLRLQHIYAIAVMVDVDRTRSVVRCRVVLAPRVILDADRTRGVVRCRVALPTRARL